MTEPPVVHTVNTILYCRRWPETVDFYRRILQLEISAQMDWFVEFRLNQGACLSIADESRARVSSAAGQGLTLTLRVADLDATWAWLQAQGAAPGPIRDHPWGARVCYLHDPEGHRLEFWTPGDPPGQA